MLAGVLLHVVEAAGPVQPAMEPLACDRAGQEVGDPVTLVYDVDDLDAAEVAGIERLAAGRRIEGRAVEVDAAAVISPATTAASNSVR